MNHNYEKTFDKGEHIEYPDNYVWECVQCGKEVLTKANVKPVYDGCIPSRAVTRKS